jgi:hypothetical protein
MRPFPIAMRKFFIRMALDPIRMRKIPIPMRPDEIHPRPPAAPPRRRRPLTFYRAAAPRRRGGPFYRPTIRAASSTTRGEEPVARGIREGCRAAAGGRGAGRHRARRAHSVVGYPASPDSQVLASVNAASAL